MLDEALAFEPGWKLAAKLRDKRISSVELTELFLSRIERIDLQVIFGSSVMMIMGASLVYPVLPVIVQSLAVPESQISRDRRDPLS